MGMNYGSVPIGVNRNYKDTVFRMLYRAEVHAVSLFEYDAERVRKILDEEKLSEGKMQYRQLILAMQKDGRESEIPRLAMDETFEKEMMAYYKIG